MEEPFGLKEYGEGEVEQSRDPVCGAVVDDDAAPKTEWAGQTYYFCSKACLELFKRDPAEYLGGRIA
jgi:YHS domain-containing protein